MTDVKVKPLEWGEWIVRDRTLICYSVVGVYMIDSGPNHPSTGEPWCAWTLDDEDVYFHGERADSVESAKAAAQADYERRIRSAIEPTDTRAEAMEKADE